MSGGKAKPDSRLVATWTDLMLHKDHSSLRIYLSQTETEFFVEVIRGLHVAISKIEAGSSHYYGDSEEKLSFTLSSMLTMAHFECAAEVFHNGHVDITVCHPRKEMKMLGECKIYKGFVYHRKGCEQLLRRYSSGRSAWAFCLEFFREEMMLEKVDRVRRAFDKSLPLEQIAKSSAYDGGGTEIDGYDAKGAFITKHKHFNGFIVDIVHLGCSVFHPETAARAEKAAASAKKGKATKRKAAAAAASRPRTRGAPTSATAAPKMPTRKPGAPRR